MTASQPQNCPGSLQIDPEANLAIYLYLRDGTKRLSMAPPLRTNLNTPPSPDTLSPTTPTTPTSPPQLTIDRVSDMTLSQLDHLQERVCQMEISNYGLLTRIYGRFPHYRQPFPVVIASRLSSSEFPERGSSEHRQLLFSQYKSMLAIAQDPTQCVNSIEPATAQGAKALQDYQLQLLLIAEQRRKQLKRKSQYEEDNQRFIPLKVEPASFKAMQQHCGVLEFDPRPAQRRKENHDHLTNRALADYQKQLLLLEEQNRKRLLVAKREQEVKVTEVYCDPGSQTAEPEELDDGSSIPIRRLGERN